MKITKEEFNKLSQLDRIEFRQKQDRIYNNYGTSNFSRFINSFLLIFIFVFSIGTFLASIGSIDIAKNLIYSILSNKFLLNVIYLCLIASIVCDILFSIKKKKLQSELEEEFFKVKIKKEGKK